MGRSKKHIIYLYLLLTTFVSGEIILFTHQHEISKCCGLMLHDVVKKGYHAHKSDTGKCFLCDVIMNKKFFLHKSQNPATYFTITENSIIHVYKNNSLQKKLTQSRGPPIEAFAAL
jgi:hypothetical protein